MMKTLTILLAWALSIPAFSQTLPYDETANKVSYAAVVEAPGMTAAQLYALAQQWVAANSSGQYPLTVSFENGTDVIQASGGMGYPSKGKKIDCLFTVKIQTKDGKYRYEVSGFQLSHTTEAGASGGGFSYWSKSTVQEAKTFQYPLEQFYPSRVEKKGGTDDLLHFEEVNAGTFDKFHTQVQAFVGSLRQVMSVQNDW